MNRKPTALTASAPLRHRAETVLRKQSAKDLAAAGHAHLPAASQRTLHELEVHQIELRMQNEDLKRVRDELEAGLEKYSELYDFAPVGYLTLDQEGSILEANLKATSVLGVARSPLVQRRLALFVAPADRPLFADFLEQVFAGRAEKDCEVRLLVKGKPAATVLLKANLSESKHTCWVALTDVTQHRLAEEKMRISEIRFRRLFETTHDGILLVNPATRKIADANPFMTKLLGYAHDELVGKELFEIGLLKDEAASQVMFRKLTKKHEVRYEDLPLESQDGRHQEVEVVANLYQENGHSVVQCNIRDITQRKRVEKTLHNAQAQLAGHARHLQAVVTARTKALVATNQQLSLALDSTRLGEEQNRILLLESQAMHKKLRNLTHQILTAQEEERKKVSRELHDEVVQTLVGINVELSALVHGNSPDVKHLKDKIARTQRLVESSVDAVHRFARQLRPAVLDDLGLIPALHAFCRSLAARKKLKIRMTASSGVEALDGDKRTVLFRVAQEALTNVARHARAKLVKLSISKIPGAFRLEIVDDGRSFPVQKILDAKTKKRLGLVGMRERVEMIGGCFTLESTPGKGTTVRAEIPLSPIETKQ